MRLAFTYHDGHSLNAAFSPTRGIFLPCANSKYLLVFSADIVVSHLCFDAKKVESPVPSGAGFSSFINCTARTLKLSVNNFIVRQISL